MNQANWIFEFSLLDLIGNVETKTKKEFDDKAEDFQKAYTLLDRRLNELEQEVVYLENMIYLYIFRTSIWKTRIQDL